MIHIFTRVELRTPIQPILGLTQVIRSESKDSKQSQLLHITIRNAKDVTKIESNSLQLKKEQINLNEMILIAITDSRNHSEKSIKNNNMKLELASKSKEEDIIRSRHEQVYHVISNLLSMPVFEHINYHTVCTSHPWC